MVALSAPLAPPYVIGIDIGGTNFRVGAVAGDGSVLCAQISSSRDFLAVSNPLDELRARIQAFCEKMPPGLRGICLGFPGTVKKDKKTVASCPNIPVFNGMNVADAMQEAFHVPVWVEHEVILLLSNDLQQHQLSDRDCVIALYLGTGLGNAIYIHGRFLDGKNGNSGELGHIPVLGNEDACPCGNSGCIELCASGKRLEQIRQQYFPKTASLDEMLDLHSKSPVILAFLDAVACALATEINILDPDVVLIGGGVVNISSFPYETLLELVRHHARKPYPAANLTFMRIPSDAEQGVRGAGLYAWKLLDQ